MNKTTTKRAILMAVIFSVFAIFFALVYAFDFISAMDAFLALTYVCYFIGIAMLYNGAYQRNKKHESSTKLSFIFGLIFIAVAIGLLIYGFSTGYILFF